MNTYAHVVGGTVAELFTPPQGFTLAECFAPAVAANFVDVTSVSPAPQPGWTAMETDGAWSFAAPAPPPVNLLVYANLKQWSLATGGFTVTVNGQALTFATDETSQPLLNGKVSRLGQANPPATVNWQFATGFVTLSAADFLAAAVKIADFVQATFDALAVVFAAIEAGTITTTAEVDASAWPANHS